VLAAGLLFFLPVNAQRGEFTLSWKQAANIDWGTILLFGGGLAFGHLMVKTGLAEAVGRGMVALFGGNALWSLTAVAIGAALIFTEMASNTAAASMLVPVVIAIAQSANVSPVPPNLGVCMAASLAFVLPVSTPPNAIVYGTGLVPQHATGRCNARYSRRRAYFFGSPPHVSTPGLNLRRSLGILKAWWKKNFHALPRPISDLIDNVIHFQDNPPPSCFWKIRGQSP